MGEGYKSNCSFRIATYRDRTICTISFSEKRVVYGDVLSTGCKHKVNDLIFQFSRSESVILDFKTRHCSVHCHSAVACSIHCGDQSAESHACWDKSVERILNKLKTAKQSTILCKCCNVAINLLKSKWFSEYSLSTAPFLRCNDASLSLQALLSGHFPRSTDLQWSLAADSTGQTNRLKHIPQSKPALKKFKCLDLLRKNTNFFHSFTLGSLAAAFSSGDNSSWSWRLMSWAGVE